MIPHFQKMKLTVKRQNFINKLTVIIWNMFIPERIEDKEFFH